MAPTYADRVLVARTPDSGPTEFPPGSFGAKCFGASSCQHVDRRIVVFTYISMFVYVSFLSRRL